METIYEEDYFIPDHLPGYVSPTIPLADRGPKANRTILDNAEGSDLQAVQYDHDLDIDDRWLQKAWEKHDAMKAEFLHIVRLIQKRDAKPKMARGEDQKKTDRFKLSRIPLPIFWYQRVKGCPVTSPVNTEGQTAVKPSQIPLPVKRTGKEFAAPNLGRSKLSAGKPSWTPVPSPAMTQDQRYPEASSQVVPYTIYHTPGKHVTIVPQSQDILLRQRKSRLPVWMNPLRMSQTVPRSKDERFWARLKDSLTPLPVPRVNAAKGVCKVPCMKRAKRAIEKKLKDLSPRASFSKLGKFFKKLS